MPRFKGQGTQNPPFNGRIVKGHNCRFAFVIGDIIAAILQNTRHTVGPLIKIYIPPTGKMRTLPSLELNIFITRVQS